MRYVTISTKAREWNVSSERIRQWLAAGRIKGASKPGRDWIIPENAQRPERAKPGELQSG